MYLRVFYMILIFISAEACDLIGNSMLACDDIKEILRYHNELRNDVALMKTKLKGAKNMWKLKWDENLANMATEYANKCKFQHNKNRPKDIGENLAWKADDVKKRADITEMAAGWHQEMYNYQSPSKKNGTVGHFTQMIWGETKFIGCGMAFYKDKEKTPATPYNTLLVCNYRPVGNLKEEQPYEVYDGADRCDNGLACEKFSGLCAHDKEHQDKYYVPCSNEKGRGRRLGDELGSTDQARVLHPPLLIQFLLYFAIMYM